MKLPVAFTVLVSRKDGEDSPAFEFLERREAVIERF